VNRGGAGRRLWILDFDGTVSDLVPDRKAARLHPACGRFLRNAAGRPLDTAAVISSRTLDDLASRIAIPGIFLGGSSGMEWRIPGGHRLRPGNDMIESLERARRVLIPLLERFRRIPGVEVEDKGWSVSIHYRRMPARLLGKLKGLLHGLDLRPDLRVFGGPASAEIQPLPWVDKSVGTRRLCRFLRTDPRRNEIVYAGDDENDAAAMRWVLSKGGTAFTVGGRITVSGATAVEDPESLARALSARAGGGDPRCEPTEREVSAR
jgi:trehalose-phosphatase